MTLVPLRTIYVANSVDDLKNAGHSCLDPAILKAGPVFLRTQTLRAALQGTPKIKFNVIANNAASMTFQNMPLALAADIQAEIERMTFLHAAWTGAYKKLLVAQIQRLAEPMHTHPYAVTLKAIGGTGALIRTDEGEICAAEADTTFVPAGIDHASTDFYNEDRKVIAIYVDPEPAGMRPW